MLQREVGARCAASQRRSELRSRSQAGIQRGGPDWGDPRLVGGARKAQSGRCRTAAVTAITIGRWVDWKIGRLRNYESAEGVTMGNGLRRERIVEFQAGDGLRCNLIQVLGDRTPTK